MRVDFALIDSQSYRINPCLRYGYATLYRSDFYRKCVFKFFYIKKYPRPKFSNETNWTIFFFYESNARQQQVV